MHELSDEEKLLNEWLSRDHEGKRPYVYEESKLNERLMCAGRIPPLFGGTHCPPAFARQAIADEPWTLVWKSKNFTDHDACSTHRSRYDLRTHTGGHVITLTTKISDGRACASLGWAWEIDRRRRAIV